MADEDITLNEDQLLEDVNGEAELLNEVNIFLIKIFFYFLKEKRNFKMWHKN